MEPVAVSLLAGMAGIALLVLALVGRDRDTGQRGA